MLLFDTMEKLVAFSNRLKLSQEDHDALYALVSEAHSAAFTSGLDSGYDSMRELIVEKLDGILEPRD